MKFHFSSSRGETKNNFSSRISRDRDSCQGLSQISFTISSENTFHGDISLALEFLLQFSNIPYHTFIWTTGKTTFTGLTEYGFLNNC